MAEDRQDNEDEKLRRLYSKRLRALQIEQQKKDLAKRFMDPDAYERLMNVRISNYELYEQLLGLVINMVQTNRLGSKLTDEQLKSLLAKLTYRPEPKIEYRHK